MGEHENGTSRRPEPKVCLVISSFRNDEAVARILSQVFASGEHPFCRIVVVDSLGTGKMPDLLRERGWHEVEYRCYPQNLGSAGNLAERLRLAAATEADLAYAVNHDAFIDLDVVKILVEEARQIDRLGAVFPLRRMINLRDRLDTTGDLLPLTLFGARPARALPALMPVQWSSSNGALYSLTPIREGLTPWGDFWLAWEDLAYGWLLEAHGYRQYIVTRARLNDDYEYREHRVGPFKLALVDKPSWIAYYQIRNLVLAVRRTGQGVPRTAMVASRVALEFALTALFRPEKTLRLRNLFRGLVDGLAGRSGKWVLP
jgi:hypothetical protein